MDLYQILEIKPNATSREIKEAYLRLAKIYHPDKNSDKDTTKEFIKIKSAYDILSNDKLRETYIYMNPQEQNGFIELLKKFINNEISMDEIKQYISKLDFEYISNNYMNFINNIDISELLHLYKNGKVIKKDYSILNCSEMDMEYFDENCCEYYNYIPILNNNLQSNNNLNINIEINIKLYDILNNNKRKIKIKRKIEDDFEYNIFVFNTSHQYIIYKGAGDVDDNLSGDLIIKLNLPPNYIWEKDIIMIEENMTLYNMIYGMNININLGEDKYIEINKWVPSRDGLIIMITNNPNIKIDLGCKKKNLNLAIRLILDYKSTPEKQKMLLNF
jgi:DnaJ-class molecular chaperone